MKLTHKQLEFFITSQIDPSVISGVSMDEYPSLQDKHILVLTIEGDDKAFMYAYREDRNEDYSTLKDNLEGARFGNITIELVLDIDVRENLEEFLKEKLGKSFKSFNIVE